MGEAGEEELAGGVAEAAQVKAAQAAVVLEAGVQALDVGGAALAEGAALGGAQPVRVRLHGGGIVGRGPSAGSRRARSRGLPSAMSRSGPGADRFASLW